MTRQEFISKVLLYVDPRASILAQNEVRRIADLIYDPLLCDDDGRQMKLAAMRFSAIAEDMFATADSLYKQLEASKFSCRGER